MKLYLFFSAANELSKLFYNRTRILNISVFQDSRKLRNFLGTIGPGPWLQGSLFVSLKKTLDAFIYVLIDSNLQMVLMIASPITPIYCKYSICNVQMVLQCWNGPWGSNKLLSTLYWVSQTWTRILYFWTNIRQRLTHCIRTNCGMLQRFRPQFHFRK